MAYVDLNPVRAKMTNTPEESNHTTGILFSAVDYLELIDYTGRIVKEGKRGTANQLTPPILKKKTKDKLCL